MTGEKFSVRKNFSIPMGHRLSKHLGKCLNIHGHNFKFQVCISSEKLNENDMVIDFSDLKIMVTQILDDWDHALMVNKNDPILKVKELSDSFKVIICDFEPTAEQLSKILYFRILELLSTSNKYKHLSLEYVNIYENENSMTSYKLIQFSI